MKRTVYIIAGIAVNVVLALIFREHINITAASLVPLISSAISSAIAASCVLHPDDHTLINSQTAYNTANITPDEIKSNIAEIGNTMTLSIPFYLPFIIFLGTAVKVIFSVLIMFAAFAAGGILFRLRHGREMKARIEHERKELEAQRKKEESGKI